MTCSKGGVHEIRLVTVKDASGSVRIIEARDDEVPNYRAKFVWCWFVPSTFCPSNQGSEHRSPNYQGNTVYAGRWTRLRCRRWVRVGCSIATRAINTCQTGSVDTSPRPRYASCLGKNNLHHTAFLWTTSAVPRVFSKGCILDSRLQCTRMFGILLVCGLRVYGCLCCAHIPVTSGGTR